ncbi:tRNA(Met) cytidine acetyltransferase TmcA [Ectothiorhodospira marina]|jgi:tRNA(Met) cytidine acetyltransferase|uniref:tRNA(Met) cytidine acetyltransferase TmcA n=1 Tax=Ectothiorhodospira marina TaxID=1396821 RepID=A0A1H7QM09_9GAMM|nr:GNAT family N-acetyltransferase [Ectothiorhodospira marina]SEL48956.1 tRNA(Met) cytidine acetyltransferase [Ectothiorhodospira marina]
MFSSQVDRHDPAHRLPISCAQVLATPANSPEHRRLVWLAGPAGPMQTLARDWTRGVCETTRIAWVGPAPASSASCPLLPAAQADTLLGRTLDALILDATAGLHPDALGAATGAVRGGGVVLLILPREQAQASRFGQRCLRVLEAWGLVPLNPSHGCVTTPDLPLPLPVSVGMPRIPDEDGCLTTDQRQAVQALEHLARGRARRPLVLTADRGRGKSAALGMAAAALLVSRRHLAVPDAPYRILVTAPRLASVAPVFVHARAGLENRGLAVRQEGGHRLEVPGAMMEYGPPDEACDTSADLLLVDEAAGLPVHWLIRLLEGHQRVAFATTLHGYEGAGQGFATRFQGILRRRVPQTRFLHLTQPIRWAVDDPVEALMDRLLMLSPRPVNLEDDTCPDPEEGVAEVLSPSLWLENESLLEQVFGLLVLAHYRTRPSDLQRLLDDPHLQVLAWRHQGQVLAVALLAREGGLNDDVNRAVAQGRRRPQGHFLPVGMILYGGAPPAAGRLGYERVVRIAVHPRLQRQGLGTALLKQVVDHARQDGADLVGAGFGATQGLLDFWRGEGFEITRIGVKPEVSSGGWGATVLRPLTPEGRQAMEPARSHFVRGLPRLLAGPLCWMEPDLVVALGAGSDTPPPEPRDIPALEAFARWQRPFEACLPELDALIRWGLSDPARLTGLPREQRHALVMCLLQQRSWEATARALGVSGRKSVIRCLRQGVEGLAKQFWGA